MDCTDRGRWGCGHIYLPVLATPLIWRWTRQKRARIEEGSGVGGRERRMRREGVGKRGSEDETRGSGWWSSGWRLKICGVPSCTASIARFLPLSPFLSPSLSLSLSLSPSLSLSLRSSSSFFLGSLALFIFLSIALCGMKLSLLVAGVTVCRARVTSSTPRASARAYTQIGRGREGGRLNAERVSRPFSLSLSLSLSLSHRGAVATVCAEWRR